LKHNTIEINILHNQVKMSCHRLFYDMQTRYVYGETLCFVLYRTATPFRS